MSQFSQEIEKELREISHLLADIRGKNVFTCPADYFQSLPSHVIQSVLTEESKSLSENENISLPEYLREKNVFEAPSNYFYNLASEVHKKIKEEPARVISIKRRPFFNYAIAAVISGSIGLSLFNLWSKPQEGATEDIRPLLAAADKIISNGSFQQEWELLQEDEITSFLSANGHDIHAALVASASENSELPAPLDYIVKDDALGEFLDQLELTTDHLNK